jgi:N-acylglucosamine-6-phosphate 2-epimerase
MGNYKFDRIRNKLIVSCQAEGNSPFNNPEDVAKFAVAAKDGGAGGIRAEGVEKIKKIKEIIDLPIIALIKSNFDDGYVRITRTFKEVEALLGIDVDIIAIDGTLREVEGMTGPEFIHKCKEKYSDISILADIAELEDAIECIENGADGISNALRGYTPNTTNEPKNKPNIDFLRLLCNSIRDVPIIAEGKICSPEDAGKIANLNVWSIVVGSAITRPHLITKWYVDSIKILNE